MLRFAVKGALALLHAVYSCGASHETVFIDSRFNPHTIIMAASDRNVKLDVHDIFTYNLEMIKLIKHTLENHAGKLAVVSALGLFLWAFVATQEAMREANANLNEMGVQALPNGNKMYEVQFDNQKYIVISTHRGIGVCKK